jgi:hypothetical protein
VSKLTVRVLLLALAATVPGWSQFELFLVNGNLEQTVQPVDNLGAVEPGSSLAVAFRIRNVSANAAILDYLQVTGGGFTLSNVQLPVTLAPQKSVDFTVIFQSAGSGFYSGALDSVGISVLLSALVPAELTCELDTGAGVRPLATAAVDFGQVERGAGSSRHILLVNQTSVPLYAPAPLVTGDGFGLSGASPGGSLVLPGATADFNVQFSPTVDGALAGTLSVGDRTYALTGTGLEPPLPRPRISVSLPQQGSAQQGSVTVNLDAPSKTTGTGTVALAFVPDPPAPNDPGIAFATAGQSATFTVSPGDTQGHFGTQLTAPFQTGTTSGTLSITVQLGGTTDQQSVAILPAVVGVTAAQGARSAGAIEVDLTGFDNTRSASALAFTFFDGAGKVVGPGAIQADGGASFASYFRSAAGGTFMLKAVFPVTGDATQIKAFEAVVTNSAGSATTARISF